MSLSLDPVLEPPSSPPAVLVVSKKRHFDDIRQLSNPSSDGAVFSSDPADPSLDTESRKRQYKGTWWGIEVPKSEFSRNFDSGVWMSDESEESLPTPDQYVARRRPSPGPLSHRSPQQWAESIIAGCLDNQIEVVDLSDLELGSLSDSLLSPLSSLTKPPRFTHAQPSEKEYAPLLPDLQLFLAHNSLRSLPPSTWHLGRLAVLSLRNNKLTSIPSSIANLHNLVELNVAGNRLRWLPWELLGLIGPGKPLKRLHLKPNPLFQGVQFQGELVESRNWVLPSQSLEFKAVMEDIRQRIACKDSTSETYAQDTWLLKLMESLWDTASSDCPSLSSDSPGCLWESTNIASRTLRIASTPPTYYNLDGSLPLGRASPSRLPWNVTSLPAKPYDPSSNPRADACRVPSLFELAISSCATYPSLAEFESLLPSDAPLPVVKALRMATEAREEGGMRKCSVCSRNYIIPRSEWIEYHHRIPNTAGVFSVDELFCPFLRRGCSWGCIA